MSEKHAAPVPDGGSPPHQTPADLLLEIAGVTLCEVKGQQRTPVAEHMDLVLLSITPTEEDLELARQQLHVTPGGLNIRAGEQMVFAHCGQYKIPVAKNVPVIQESKFCYVFAIPSLFMAINFPPDTQADEIEAFQLLIKTYGILREKPGVAFQQPQYSGAPPASSSSAAAVASASTTPEYVARRPDGTVATVGEEGDRISTKVALGILSAGAFAASGIRKGAQLLSTGVGKGTDAVVSHTTACQKPVVVSQDVSQKVRSARAVTKSAVMVSGGVASAMIGVSAVLGGKIAGVVGNRVSARTGNDPKLEAVKEVGGAVIGTAGLLFIEASDAARMLLTASCEGISKVVTHKLGQQAGETTAEGLGLVQDAVALQNNIKSVGVRALVRHTASHTAGKLLDDEPPPPPPPS